MQPFLEEELDRLVKMDVLSKIDYSEWAAPIVVVKKANGKIRVCADFSTGLNEALVLHQYPLPKPEDILITLNGGQEFTQLDLFDAYLQIPMEDQSAKLLVVNTHKGLFQYNRLPFGVKSAPAIFQQLMEQVLSGLSGVAAYLDDVIITGRNRQEHLENLSKVLSRFEQFGLRLRREKCSFLQPKVKYLGFIIDKNGIQTDPDKVKAIKNMPRPKDIKSLRSYLGFVNHYGKFVPRLYDLRSPLDNLLKKDVPWNWSDQCEDSFAKIRSILMSPLVLTHFQPSLPLFLAADASNIGIGAVIYHRFPDGSEKVIAHASKTLTDAEKNYSQIEKEALGLVYGVKKYHQYIWGNHFTLVTDHKPLVTIFGSKKGIPTTAANRLQRWAIILMGYSFDIMYKSTSEFGQVDGLSRLPIGIDEEFDQGNIFFEHQINQLFDDILENIPVLPKQIMEHTSIDPFLNKVLQYIFEGFPPKIRHPVLRNFAIKNDELSAHNGCIFLNDRIVIPSSLQGCILRQLHTSHPGMNRMKSLARSLCYWYGMDNDIERYVRNCDDCANAAKNPVKVPLQPWPTPLGPWKRIHIDFAGPFKNSYFLLVIDAYSKWPEIIQMKKIDSQRTINELCELFARYGLPETLVSDNGPQFTSKEFVQFCATNAIDHVFTPPYHPQSNGQVERFVDTFKRAMYKSQKDYGDLNKHLRAFLFMYRRTPLADRKESPSELFIGRCLRSTLDIMLPKPVSMLKSHANNKENMKNYFNKHHGAQSREYVPGEIVQARNYRGPGTWKVGIVLQKIGNVKYKVRVEGVDWIRHANQIKNYYGNQQVNDDAESIDDFTVQQPQLMRSDSLKTTENTQQNEDEVTSVADSSIVESSFQTADENVDQENQPIPPIVQMNHRDNKITYYKRISEEELRDYLNERQLPRTSGRLRKFVERLVIDPKEKKYKTEKINPF
uniref:RNA-directed DNA polymerase n=1 Tax=Acrobeloides nanus TaxID=290746 RepID=A0A914DCM8_9BILA